MSLPRTVCLVAIVLGLPLSPLLLAQTRDPAKRPPPINTITKTDGSTVKGTIVSADPDNVVLKPAGKPGEEVADVTIGWADIKKVSNGLTREKAWAQWKDLNRANLCTDCNGDRTVRCDICKGTGHDPAASANCATCKGEMEIECRNAKCDNGQMPCPSPCLKLSEGRWYEKDGKKWRKFTGGGGALELSEGHVGELWKITKNGPVNEGKCTRCLGTTIVDCVDCGGIGKQTCKVCLNDTKAGDCTQTECEKGRTPCLTCNETGLKQQGV